MSRKKSQANQSLGLAIRSTRMQRGWAQEAFARAANLDRSYYGAIERGEFNISVDTLMKLTVALEMTASELFERAGL
jgi:transcriptional regulator with XRE-family HTH domain